ncbi:MAG: hypothetical protein HC902_08140 [Calothrix sp. SM1_5_4]|nr:hypothetical protein [Calothrix sp. SM1_5_4]
MDVMNRYRAQEKAFLDGRVDAGRKSTAAMRLRAESAAQALTHASNAMARINSEFTETTELKDTPEIVIRGEFAALAQNVERKIERIETFSPQAANMKNLASKSLFEAKQSWLAGLTEDARFYLKIAEGVADLALGLDPVTGFYRSLLETVTGHNAVTGETLSNLERGFAAMGVVTAGTTEQARRGLRLIAKLGGHTEIAERVIRVGEATGQAIPKILDGLKGAYDKFRAGSKAKEDLKILAAIENSLIRQMPEFKVLNILDAESINLTYRPEFHPPFQTWTHGFEIATMKKERFIRFSQLSGPNKHTTGLSEPIGGFLAREKDVLDLKNSKMSAEQIREALKARFSIKGDAPLYISDVIVPEGKRLYSGKVMANFGGQEGAMQYALIDGIPVENFYKTRRIEDWLAE